MHYETYYDKAVSHLGDLVPDVAITRHILHAAVLEARERDEGDDIQPATVSEILGEMARDPVEITYRVEEIEFYNKYAANIFALPWFPPYVADHPMDAVNLLRGQDLAKAKIARWVYVLIADLLRDEIPRN